MTIWLNLGTAALIYLATVVFGPMAEWWLAPVSILVLIYSLSHDWHVDAAAYREALAELSADNRSS